MTNLKIGDGIHLREIGNEGILYDTRNKKVHVLNNTAVVVWKQCCANQTPEQIAQTVSEQFQVPFEQVLADVHEMLATFADANLCAGQQV
jgi:hypothetical protein